MKWMLCCCVAWLPSTVMWAQASNVDLDAWIHDGVAGPLVVGADANTTLAWQLAQLLPATHGIAAQVPPTAAIRQSAVQRVLQFWAADAIPLSWQDASYARLRGQIDQTAATQIAAMLQQESVPRRTELLSLLLEAPFAEVRSVLIDFTLEESNPAEDRGRVVATLLLLDGRRALHEILPTIRPDAEPPYLRRLFAAWRTCITPEDLPLLQKLAMEAEGFVGQFALQLWAMHARNPEARMLIFKLASGTDSSYRTATMAALARGGLDPEIGAAWVAELQAGDRNARRLARRFIPVFAGEQALLDAYQQREAGMSANQRNQWMPDIARLSLPAAAHIAMQWLVDGGWASGAPARSVVRYLARSEEVDPLLATLLSIEDLPQDIRFPLALARGPYSEDARVYLRAALPHFLPSEQSQVFQMLADHGALTDLLLMRDFVMDPAKPSSSRVEGMRALATVAEARALMGQWRDPLPEDYEMLATLMELFLLSEQAELQQWAFSTALSPPDFFDADERRGLRTLTWRVLGQRCAPGDAEILATTIATQLLAQESSTLPGEAWSQLFRFESNFPELAMALASYLSCSRSQGLHSMTLPADFDSHAVAADVLVVAASYLAEAAPETAAAWFADLAKRPLQPEDLLRVAGLSASRLPAGPASNAALEQLLANPQALRAYPRVVAQSFAPVGLGWVLLHDRLAEQHLLVQVLQGQRPLLDLQVLLGGWVEDGILAAAANFALETGSEEAKRLALSLQQRRTVHLPLSGEIHAAVAKLAASLGALDLAQKEGEIVQRLTPRDSTSSP